MTALKNFDFIVFGATGFVGQVASNYFAKNSTSELRWAIAGRSAEKLNALHSRLKMLPHPPEQSLIVDQSDVKLVRAAVEQCRVAVCFAGPFAQYGNHIVSACAELGVHYLDITGEPLWVRQMIDRHETAARSSGAVLIPFSGFDSVPSDLGVQQVLNNARAKSPNHSLTKIIGLFSMKGGINGGSFQTLLDIFENPQFADFSDSSLLVPREFRDQFQFRDPRGPVYVPQESKYAPPFFMAPINSRVVYRSQAIRISRGEQQTPIEYMELLKVGSPGTKIKAQFATISSAALEVLGTRKWGRRILKWAGPRAGQGPTPEEQEGGFFKARFFAYSGNALVAKSEMAFAGDPGNKATALFICESTFSLLNNLKHLPRGGFWTPSMALGEVLVKRLRQAGVILE